MKVHPILKISLVIVILIAVVLPLMYARAALVPCGTSENPQMCTLCDFFQLVDNVKNFLMVNIVTPLAVLFIVIGGVFILFAGASPSNYARGKGIVTNTIIGVFLIFSTWMITNTIIQLVAGDSNISRTWYSLQCSVTGGVIVGNPTPTPTGQTPPLSTGGTLLTCSSGGRASRCVDCKPIQYGSSRNQGPRTDHAAASLADFLNNRLSPALLAAGIRPLFYNDGICPNSSHASPAHYTGHAMDINGVDMATTEKICKILNDLGVRRHEPGTGYLGNTTNVYIVESRSPRDSNPNSACPRNSPGGAGLHLQY